jgi:hypothetical protein
MNLKQLFRRTPVRNVLDDQLYDARIKAIEARAAAEHYLALADMYDRRVQRLQDAIHNTNQEQA